MEPLIRTLQAAWRSGVGKNAASLYLIQFANYILPLILLPYLVRVLGPTHFGLVAFGQGLIAYFNIFVDYGFALSATRRISVERDDLLAVSRTASTVWAVKGLLCILALAILLSVITVVPKLREVNTLLLTLYGLVVGNALFPIWLFQGMEKMFFISVINLAMRLLVVAGVFTMIRRPEHYLLYAGLTSLGALGAGLAGVVIAFYRFRLRLFLPTWADIWEALKEGWLLFLSTASTSLYAAGNAFILGLLANPTAVGYYSVAEKIVKSTLGLVSPLSQAAYPRFSKIASESKERTIEWGKRMTAFMGVMGGMLTVVILLSAPFVTMIFLGAEFRASIGVIRILSPIILLISISNVLGVQILFPFHQEKKVFTVVLTAGLLNIGMALLLAPRFEAQGMALAVLVSETFVTVAYYAIVQLTIFTQGRTGVEQMIKTVKRCVPRPLKNVLRPLHVSGRHCFYTIRFRVKYGFSPPPRGTDMVGYEQLIEFIDKNRIYKLGGDLLEIGTFLGGGAYKLSKYISQKAPDKKLYVVDIFDPDFDSTACITGEKMHEIYLRSLRGRNQEEVFKKVTRSCTNIVVIKGDSKKVELPENTLCFAFIDGNHDPVYVENDFYLAWKRLIPGGFVGFDDYGYDLPQVTATIDRLIERHREEIGRVEKQGRKIIFIQKREHHA